MKPIYYVRGVGSAIWHAVMPRNPTHYEEETACGLSPQTLQGATAEKLGLAEEECSVCIAERATMIPARLAATTWRPSDGC